MKYSRIFLIFLVASAIIGCTDVDETITTSKIKVTKAKAHLQSLNESNVQGVVELSLTNNNNVILAGEIRNLPGTEHAIHIHQRGDCSSVDGKSAGGHYTPDNNPHGHPDDNNHHLGDLGNITAENGIARFKKEMKDARLNGYFHSLVGRSIVIHADPDDFQSQPAGAAGKRIACGVIGVIEDEIK